MDTPYHPAEEIVLRRQGWIPNVVRKNGVLHLEFGGGAAGTEDPFNDEAAIALLDPILFGSEPEVEALFIKNNWDTQGLVAFNADITLLNQGALFASLQNATEEANQQRAAEYAADKERASREVILSDLDAAILRYTNQYLYRSGIPVRKPDEVDPALLSQVLEVLATVEKAAEGIEFTPKSLKEQPYTINKEEWNSLRDKVNQAITDNYPSLTSDAVNTISNLLCSEASSRARKA